MWRRTGPVQRSPERGEGQQGRGWAPLHGASKYGHSKTVTALIKSNASPNIASKGGVTPLILAAAKNKMAVVRVLVEAGADITIRGDENKNAAEWAKGKGHSAVAKYLANEAPRIVEKMQTDELGKKLLEASKKGKTAEVKRLISKGANLDWQDKNGWAPLHYASHYGKAKTVVLLVSKGADISQATNDGVTPLYIASQYGKTDIVQLLISKGADINKAKKNGWTPLHIASQNGKTDIVQLLISKGADINKAKNGFGDTPLIIAAYHNEMDVVRVLVKGGADITIRGEKSKTAAELAKANGNHAIAKYLADKTWKSLKNCALEWVKPVILYFWRLIGVFIWVLILEVAIRKMPPNRTWAVMIGVEVGSRLLILIAVPLSIFIRLFIELWNEVLARRWLCLSLAPLHLIVLTDCHAPHSSVHCLIKAGRMSPVHLLL